MAPWSILVALPLHTLGSKMGRKAGSSGRQAVKQAEPTVLRAAAGPARVTGWSRAAQAFSSLTVVNFRFLPGVSVLAISPFAGAFSERVDRRLLAGVASTVNGLSALAIAILIVSGHV